MSFNPLYAFLRKYPSLLPVMLESRFKKTISDQKQYCILEIKDGIPLSISSDDNSYQLTSHHITIFKLENPSIPTRNEYHYTAYFLDSMGKNYRLHVYFNGRDNLTTDPVFDQLGEAGSAISTTPVTQTVGDALYSHFIDIAQMYAVPKVRELRKRHQETITDLDKTYTTLEKQAASLIAAEPTNYMAYCTKLDEVADVLTTLSSLVRSDHYLKCRSLIEQLKNHIQAQTTAKADTSEAALDTMLLEPPMLAPIGAAEPMRSQTSSTRPPLVTIDEEIQRVCDTYASLPNPRAGVAPYIDTLVCALQALDELSIQLKDKQAHPASIVCLQQRYRILTQAVEAIYPTLLLSGELACLEKLHSFHYLISPQLLNTVLAMVKPNLLDFILKHSDLDPYKAVTVGKKTYPSVLHYCYENKDGEWLEVLIQHNISLLEPDCNGIPIANAILRDGTHPLRVTLFSNPIINSILFYKQLIAALITSQKRPGMSDTLRSKIDDDITLHRQRIAEIQRISTDILGKSALKAHDTLRSKYDHFFFAEKMKEDPMYLLLSSELEELDKKYKELLKKPQERAQHSRMAKECISRWDKALSAMNKSELTFEAVLEGTCHYLRKCIALTQSRIKFQTLQNSIFGRTIGGHASRALKRDRKEYQRLSTEIADLENELEALLRTGTAANRTPLDYFKHFNAISSTLRRLSTGEGYDDFKVTDDELEEPEDLEDPKCLEKNQRLAKKIIASLSPAQKKAAMGNLKILDLFSMIDEPNPSQARKAKEAMQHLQTVFQEQPVGFFHRSAPTENPVEDLGAPRPRV